MSQGDSEGEDLTKVGALPLPPRSGEISIITNMTLRDLKASLVLFISEFPEISTMCPLKFQKKPGLIGELFG